VSASPQSILAAARELFLEGGAERVTMRNVAERVGVTATALYRHYENREDLLRAVVSTGFEQFASYLSRSLRGKTASERLRLSGEAYLDFALDQPQMYRTIFMSVHPTGDCSPAQVRAQEQAEPTWSSTFTFLVDRVRDCMEEGSLKKAPARETGLLLWVAVHGLVSLHLVNALGEPDATFRRTYHATLARIVAGLSP